LTTYQAAKAGVKAAGVIIDDTAVTPRYVIGFAERFARFMLFSRLQFQRGALGTFMLIAPHRFGGV
jgi:hypothetical protein